MKTSFAIAVTSLVALSCVKDKPVVQPAASAVTAGRGVYVVNEGNFSSGNASVSYIDLRNGTEIADAYQGTNNEKLGDVAQSLTVINGHRYIVVNNSGKIVECDAQLKKRREIRGLVSPRYMIQVSPQRAYVSDYKSGSIAIVDLAAGAVSGSIRCPGWTERMVTLFGKVYAANMQREYVYVIDVAHNAIEDSLWVGGGCGSIVADRDNRLWALSADAKGGFLTRFDPLTLKQEVRWAVQGSPWNLTANETADTLYFLSGGIYRVPVGSTAPPAQWIEPAGRNFYGLGVNAGIVYASDALDYSQRSVVYAFDVNGSQVHLYHAGINANGFSFE